MKKLFYLLLFLNIVNYVNAQLLPAPIGPNEYIPNCDNFSSCQLFNGVQNIKGKAINSSNFYFGENCNNIQLFTRYTQAALDASSTNKTYILSNSNTVDCIPAFINYDLSYKSLHWAGEQTLKYFSSKHGLNSISGNNIHIQTMSKPGAQGYGGWVSINNGETRDFIFDRITDNHFFSSFTSNQLNSINLKPGFSYQNFNSTQPIFSYAPVSLDFIGMMWSYIIMNNLGFHSALNNLTNVEYKSVLHSYAEIFGVCVENFSEPNTADWLFGEDFCSSTPSFPYLENFQDPSSAGHPKIYQGNSWLNSSNLNNWDEKFPVNAGPHNYWFYMLTEGESGLNENGFCFNVNGIGISKSRDIVYRALTMYLSHTQPDYQNSKNATIQAATDLYGANSPELASVIAAWQAVGVLPPASSTSPLPTSSYTTINSPAEINGTFIIPYGAQLIVNNTTLTLGHNAQIIIQDGGSLRIDNSTVNLGQNARIEKQAGLGYFKTNNSTYQYGEVCPAATNFPFWGGIKIHNNPYDPNAIEITNCIIKEAGTGIEMYSKKFKFDNNTYKNNLAAFFIVNWGTEHNSINNCKFENTMNLNNIANQTSFFFIESMGNASLTVYRTNFLQAYDGVAILGVNMYNTSSSNTLRSKLIFIENETNQLSSAINCVGNIDAIIENNLFEDAYVDNSTVTFINNHSASLVGNVFSEVSRAAYLQGISNINVRNNYFRIASTTTSNTTLDHHGVLLVSCNGEIMNNEFYCANTSFFSGKWNFPVILDNTGENITRVESNRFDTDLFGVWTQGNNKGGKIKCNTFVNPALSIVVADGTIADMGVSCHPTDNLQAGNEFLNNGIVYKGANASDFNYWAHKETSAGAQTTVPAYMFGFTDEDKSLRVCDNVDRQKPNDPYDFSLWPERFKTSNSCIEGEGWRKLFEENPDLLAINTEIANLLIKKIDLTNEMSTAQYNLTNPDTEKDLVAKIDAYQKELTNTNKELSYLYEKAGNTLASKNILETAASIESKIELLKKYTAAEDFVNADRVRNELDLLYKEDYYFDNTNQEYDYDWNKMYYAELEELKKTVKLSSRNLGELTPAEINNLRIIKSEGIPISDLAEGILIMNGDPIVEHPVRKIDLSLYAQLIDSFALDTFNYALAVSPNPASNDIQISFDLPNTTDIATINIIDQYNNIGNQVYTTNLTGSQVNYFVNVNNFSNGFYSVVLEVNGVSKTSTLLQIIR